METFRSYDKDEKLITNQGLRVSDDEHSLKVCGKNVKSTCQNYWLMLFYSVKNILHLAAQIRHSAASHTIFFRCSILLRVSKRMKLFISLNTRIDHSTIEFK